MNDERPADDNPTHRYERAETRWQALRLTERIMDVSPAGITVVDASGQVRYANRRAEAILGLEAEDITQRTYADPAWKITTIDGRPMPEDELPFAQVRLTGQPVNGVEHAIEWPDGRRVLLSINAAPLHDADGAFDGMVASLEDITDRCRVERELARIWRVLDFAIEQMPIPVIIAGAPDVTITHINEAALDLLARVPSDVKRIPLERHRDYWPTFHPDGRPYAIDELPLTRAIQRAEVTRNVEINVRRDDGDHWVSASAAPLRDEQGNVVAGIVVFPEITEHKRAEDRRRAREGELRWLFKSMINAFVLFESVFDEQGRFVSYRFVYINDAYERITGVRNEDVTGKTVHEVWPGTEPSWIRKYGEVAVTGKPRSFEMYHDPTAKHYYCNVYRPWDTSDRFCVIFEDITDRKRAEDERANLEEQLRHAQKMDAIGRLAGGVAHDFNNMLQSILGYTDLLLARAADDHPFLGQLQEIRQAALRSADLTGQLLAFARKQPIAPVVLDVNRVVEEMLRMLRRLIGEDIDLRWQPGSRAVAVKMDTAQLNQILTNLVVNARDAITGVGRITIETDRVEFDADHCLRHAGFVPGTYAMLAVSDDGMGMEPDAMAKVFEPFYTTKSRDRGTGLGLATVYGIVKQNQGFLNLYSEPGEGTTLRIYLPLATGSTAEEPERAPSAAACIRSGTVLLVEDEEALLGLARQMLEELGYTVLPCATPGRALDVAREHSGPIHLLLTDVIMPEMNGRELWTRIETLRPGLPCVFMSGYTANVIAHHGVLDVGVHFLPKPFAVDALAAKVQEALEAGGAPAGPTVS